MGAIPEENEQVRKSTSQIRETGPCHDFDIFSRREKALEGKSKISHSVHCPYFTDDKQEFWWVFIADRKNHALITPPNHVTNLIDREEVELKFTAPQRPGKKTCHVAKLATCLFSQFDSKKAKIEKTDENSFFEVAFLKLSFFSFLGHYNCTVCIRSDSYMGVDLNEDIKLDVQEAREAPTEHPQWEFEDDDEEESDQEENSDDDFATDDDYEEDEEEED